MQFMAVRVIITRASNFLRKYHVAITRGGVEDTRLEAKAKDTKKFRGQGKKKISRPRTDPLEAKTKDQGHRRKCSPKKISSKIFFRRSQKKGLQKFFSGKKGLQKNFFRAIST